MARKIQLSSYQKGALAKAAGHAQHNPYGGWGGDRDDRMNREVQKRRWDAGYNDEPDPYPDGWAG